ncbi:MAG: calcium/sodium antiporter [Campylobacterales bacterium]|nr:calcium/sodium antiporter [Campylobacterales bacterium]
MDFVIFVVSMAALIWGANTLIQESERIALRFNISEFVIGATLIALGTSLPEMAASISASLDGKSQMAIANVIGSNIFNIAMILGVIFIIAKSINPERDFFAKDSYWALLPIMIFILMVLDGKISRFDGILLLLLMIAYILFLLTEAKTFIVQELETLSREIENEGKATFAWSKTLPLLFVGLFLVIVGANFTIESASNIAHSFGISEWIIGIVMISLGTSLPELMVSIAAAFKNKVEMAIGNIIGSNMANTTIVLGAAALTKPMDFMLENYLFDLSMMIVVTLMLVFITANRLYSKPAGISLLIALALFLEHTLTGVSIA